MGFSMKQRDSLKLNKLVLAVLVSFFSFSVAVGATSTKKDKNKHWSSTASLGLVKNSGNTTSQNTDGKFDVGYKKDKWDVSSEISGEYDKANQQTTAENYHFLLDGKYHCHQHHFIFSTVNYDHDDFDPYVYTAKAIVGYGWAVLNSEKYNLILQLGPGIRKQKEATSGKMRVDGIAYGSTTFSWKVSKNTTFSQALSVNKGGRNTITQSITALETMINSRLALQVAYNINHNSEIPEFSTNTHKTDFKTTVMLIYRFI